MQKIILILLLVGSFAHAKDTCEDSDGGNNPKVKGIVLMTVGPKTQQFITREKDTCKDKNTLLEYVCDKQNHSVTEIVKCPNGCDEGVCK
jgi:hypothetical protein